MIRDKQKYQSLAFSKHTPTAFVVGSPFQLLCAWNAIEEFEITDYKIVLVLEKNNIRNQQVISMLQSRNMGFDRYYAEDFRLKELLNGNMQHSAKAYVRIMVGEILDYIMLGVGALYASSNSVMVYMDDGAATIRVLTGHAFNQNRWLALIKGILRPKKSKYVQLIEQYWSQIGLHDYGFYYTIYSDIKTHRFITYPNRLDKLRAISAKHQMEKTVLIIGALSNNFAESNNISLSEYEDILCRKLNEVRQAHPHTRIIYVPHGRDANWSVVHFCKELDIEYKKLDCAIENFALNTDMEITNVYGFSSTAHYTLKLLTNAQVTSWVIMNKLNPAWYSITEIATYYRKHGITIDRIPYRNQTLQQIIAYYSYRVKEILRITK